MLFGGDESEICFARGDFYRQLLLESLELCPSAAKKRLVKAILSLTDKQKKGVV